jgi:hypothetical protein
MGLAEASPQDRAKAEQKLSEWQTVTEILIGVAEGRDFLIHAASACCERSTGTSRRCLINTERKPLGKTKAEAR